MLSRRIPRLQEKVIDAGLIDGTDGSAGVGVGGEQCALGIRKNVPGFLQKGDPVHLRHALVGEQESHAVIAHLELLQQFQRRLRRIAPNDAIFRSVLRAQVALDRTQNVGVIIDTQQNRFRHDRS